MQIRVQMTGMKSCLTVAPILNNSHHHLVLPSQMRHICMIAVNAMINSHTTTILELHAVPQPILRTCTCTYVLSK